MAALDHREGCLSVVGIIGLPVAVGEITNHDGHLNGLLTPVDLLEHASQGTDVLAVLLMQVRKFNSP